MFFLFLLSFAIFLLIISHLLLVISLPFFDPVLVISLILFEFVLISLIIVLLPDSNLLLVISVIVPVPNYFAMLWVRHHAWPPWCASGARCALQGALR